MLVKGKLNVIIYGLAFNTKQLTFALFKIVTHEWALIK